MLLFHWREGKDIAHKQARISVSALGGTFAAAGARHKEDERHEGEEALVSPEGATANLAG